MIQFISKSKTCWSLPESSNNCQSVTLSHIYIKTPSQVTPNVESVRFLAGERTAYLIACRYRLRTVYLASIDHHKDDKGHSAIWKNMVRYFCKYGKDCVGSAKAFRKEMQK